MSSNPDEIHVLTRTESVGLTVVTESGFLSLIAVCYVFFFIIRNIRRALCEVPRQRLRHIFQDPTDILMLSLFFADALQAIGAVMDMRWIHVGQVQIGRYCDAQGIVQQFGETGVALSTLLIAIYTFSRIWINRDIRSMKVTSIIVASVWVLLGMVVILGNTINMNKTPRYQAPTPYWCWISEHYMGWRIGGEYFWFWLTLGVSILIYTPLYLWSRGNIILDEDCWWKFSWQHSAAANPEQIAGRSIVMLAYPVAYCITVLPLSVVRWITFVNPGASVPGSATLAVAAIYGLSGLVNVVLLLSTRPHSVLFVRGEDPADFTSGRAPSVEFLAQENNDEGSLPLR